MSKFVLSVSMVWVVISLILGVVLVSLKPQRAVYNRAQMMDAATSNAVAPTYKEGTNTAPTQVRIEGTPIGEDKVVNTKVKIKE